MRNDSRGWFSLIADSDDDEDDDDGGGAAVCSPAPELFSKLASLPDFLKHQFAWEAAGNADNGAGGAFITFMTPRKSDIFQAIKQIISIHNTVFYDF